MRSALIYIALALALVACTRGADTFRDTSVPISASSRFDAERFAGTWLMVAAFEPATQASVTMTYVPEVGQLRVASDEVPQISGVYSLGRPGELVPLSERGNTLIVMWVDEDFETAAIGTQSGSFGAVLDRDGNLPEDRAGAIRDVLAFYGWDVAALKRTSP